MKAQKLEASSLELLDTVLPVLLQHTDLREGTVATTEGVSWLLFSLASPLLPSPLNNCSYPISRVKKWLNFQSARFKH